MNIYRNVIYNDQTKILPFFVGLGAALMVGVVSFVAISLLGTFVTL